MSPYPQPPAEPEPGASCRLLPRHFREISVRRFILASSSRASSSVAPFWRENCNAAPRSPSSGVATSVAATNFAGSGFSGGIIFASFASPRPFGSIGWPLSSRNWNPSGISSPMPPSFVALPPTPTMIVLYPLSTSFARILPEPMLVRVAGFLSASDMRLMPEASVSPTRAVSSSSRAHLAVSVWPVGSMVLSLMTFAPSFTFATVSTKLSPPSVSENSVTDASGRAESMPIFIACEACAAESDPLNLSGATKKFRFFFIAVLYIYGICYYHRL